MEEKRHGGAGRVIVVILILAVLLAARAFFPHSADRVRVETPSFSRATAMTAGGLCHARHSFPVEERDGGQVELHWISRTDRDPRGGDDLRL